MKDKSGQVEEWRPRQLRETRAGGWKNGGAFRKWTCGWARGS